MVLGAIGTVGVVVSLFLPWHDSVHPSGIPLEFLWDKTPGSADPSLLILLIPFAIVLAVGVFAPLGAGLRAFGAIGVLVVAAVFAFQLDSLLGDVGGDVGSSLDTGFYLAVIGAILALASAFVPTTTATRHDVVETDVVDDRAV
jgi:hypothetical protein